MKKKGQVTIFIIIAIVILVAIVLFFILRDSSNSEIPQTPETQALITAMDYCIESVGGEALEIITGNGGYVEPPFEESLDSFSGLIPYYYLNSQIKIPELSQVEREISSQIESEISLCIIKL